jgi:5-methyltetrahydrofolate--homocysteine methyltransferase
MDYKLHLARAACLQREFLGEACPNHATGDLAPNCLALFLGCQGTETPESVWCEPCMPQPDVDQLVYDPENFYWRFCLEASRRGHESAKGRFLQGFPDLIEGLDTLCALRSTEQALFDLVERPDFVHACMRRLTDLYFRYYDQLYELCRDELGGSHWWIYAPGRLVKIQCDMSAMISADMFREYMVPLIQEMTERTAYSLYHLDGPTALQHVPALCEIETLDMIQWQPGAGAAGPWYPDWWPYLHHMLDAGKKIQIPVGKPYAEWHFDTIFQPLRMLRKEFGKQFNQFDLQIWSASREEAEDILDCVSS